MSDEDRNIAKAHVKWYMGLLREQMNKWFEITEILLIENFEHGVKHGRELEQNKNGGLRKSASADPGV